LIIQRHNIAPVEPVPVVARIQDEHLIIQRHNIATVEPVPVVARIQDEHLIIQRHNIATVEPVPVVARIQDEHLRNTGSSPGKAWIFYSSSKRPELLTSY
jgi:hypothetical protein